MSKHLVIGICAHVDAGKTTLAEAMLYRSGAIRKAGRVDHRDSFLDTHSLERARGITIFSKQAEMNYNDIGVTLLDTPGHVDFSPEAERVMPVLDACVLVVSAVDGVQSHTYTLWNLLMRHRVPVFIFVNKTDQTDGEFKSGCMERLKKQLSESCVDFSVGEGAEFLDEIATSDEGALEEYLENNSISRERIADLIRGSKIFPVYFGSALKMDGVDEFMEDLFGYMYTVDADRSKEEFGARVFKISHDKDGNRLSYMKVESGVIVPRMTIGDEKVNQIRIYSGGGFIQAKEAGPGEICAVTGLEKTRPGQGIGNSTSSEDTILEPVLSYRIDFPEECDMMTMYRRMKVIEEEEPTLRITWNRDNNSIEANIMGEVQLETLHSLIMEQIGVDVTFGRGNIVYKETITNTSEGVGHYEPLKHYAEVHLVLEPLPRGSGMEFAVDCREEDLDKNWQRLIMTHLLEKKHVGVLTGSEITDIRITLVAGQAHEKHTEGGDFRQATYRAVRNGLRLANSILLEGVFDFRLEIPTEKMGRAMTDLANMHGKFSQVQLDENVTLFTGVMPVSEINGYSKDVASYTGGKGRLYLTPAGYRECHNTEEVLAGMNYDPEADLENPTGSVFCAHGAGYEVKWDKVSEMMHINSWLDKNREKLSGYTGKEYRSERFEPGFSKRKGSSEQRFGAEDKELQAIFERTYGVKKTKPGRSIFDDAPDSGDERAYRAEKKPSGKKISERKKLQKYLIVDGYNIVFAWEELADIAKLNIDSARGMLMDILSNYKGYHDFRLVLVFDAYKVKGNRGTEGRYKNIDVVYTKEGETADAYIERLANSLKRDAEVTVATSDGLEQLMVFGDGAARMSARDLKIDIERTCEKIREFCNKRGGDRNYLGNYMPKDTKNLKT